MERVILTIKCLLSWLPYVSYRRDTFLKELQATVEWYNDSSRGGAVAMNINSGKTPLVLLCPAWKRWGTPTTVKPGTVILHSRADDVVPFTDSGELIRISRLFSGSLIEVGSDHRLADLES